MGYGRCSKVNDFVAALFCPANDLFTETAKFAAANFCLRGDLCEHVGLALDVRVDDRKLALSTGRRLVGLAIAFLGDA